MTFRSECGKQQQQKKKKIRTGQMAAGCSRVRMTSCGKVQRCILE